MLFYFSQYQEDSFPLLIKKGRFLSPLLGYCSVDNSFTIRGFINSYVTPLWNVSYLQHCAGINCLAVWKPLAPDGRDYLFTGSRDGTLKRWELTEEVATCSATFESHIDWVLILLVLGYSSSFTSPIADLISA